MFLWLTPSVPVSPLSVACGTVKTPGAEVQVLVPLRQTGLVTDPQLLSKSEVYIITSREPFMCNALKHQHLSGREVSATAARIKGFCGTLDVRSIQVYVNCYSFEIWEFLLIIFEISSQESDPESGQR